MKNENIRRDIFLNASIPIDRSIQLRLIRAMNEKLRGEGSLEDDDEFEIFVEDVFGSNGLDIMGNRVPVISVKKAKKLLQQTGAYICDDEGWKYNSNLKVNGRTLTFQEYADLFLQELNTTKKSVPISELITRAVSRGIQWTIEATQLAIDGGLRGLPAFFTCDDKEDRLIGVNVAGTSTYDALSLLSQSPDYLVSCGTSKDEISRCFSFLLEKTLACQCVEDGFDKGGFYPLEDQPESEHPTVDATCLAIMALCTYYEQRKVLDEKLGSILAADVPAVEQAVLQGLDFLFRMQLGDGSFGIYRFESGIEAAPNENCTRMVQSTMGVCKGSGVFDSTERFEMYPACSKVIAATYDYLCSHTADAGGYTLWAPYFGKRAQDYSAADVAVSAARVCRSFIPVWWQMEDERKNIVRYNHDFLCWWKANEDGVMNKVGRYRFNSPAKAGFSVGEYFWPGRADMLAAFSVLQAHNVFDLELSAEDWALVERAVRNTLDIQHPHGHWDNPLVIKTPFCAVTLAAIELLQEYSKAKGLV